MCSAVKKTGQSVYHLEILDDREASAHFISLHVFLYIGFLFCNFRKYHIVEKAELSLEGGREEMTVLLVW